MFTSIQTQAFRRAYENYRIILGFLKDNLDMIDACGDNMQEAVKAADLELQRMFWDISLLEEGELAEAEEEFIKSIIEAPEVLKVSVPKYFMFYRNMTSSNYMAFSETLMEYTKEVLIGVRTAIELLKNTDKNYVSEMINAYKEILHAYIEMDERNKEERQKRAKIWIDRQINAAANHGISYKNEETQEKPREDMGLSSIIEDLSNLFKQQGLS